MPLDLPPEIKKIAEDFLNSPNPLQGKTLADVLKESLGLELDEEQMIALLEIEVARLSLSGKSEMLKRVARIDKMKYMHARMQSGG